MFKNTSQIQSRAVQPRLYVLQKGVSAQKEPGWPGFYAYVDPAVCIASTVCQSTFNRCRGNEVDKRGHTPQVMLNYCLGRYYWLVCIVCFSAALFVTLIVSNCKECLLLAFLCALITCLFEPVQSVELKCYLCRHVSIQYAAFLSRISRRWFKPEFVHRPSSDRKASVLPLCYALSVGFFHLWLSLFSDQWLVWHSRIILWATCWRFLVNDFTITRDTGVPW